MATQPITPSLSTVPNFIPVADIHSATWHEDRATGIGGSESASMFNEGYGCFRRLILEKRGVPADYKHTAETEKLFRRGNRMEDIIASEFSNETGLKTRKQPSRVSKTHPRARVNMDRQIVAVDPKHLYNLTRDATGFSPVGFILDQLGPGALEVKSMNTFDYKEFIKSGLVKHPHYVLQLQHTLAVTGYQWGAFVIMDSSSFDMKWFVMVRNEELIAEILERTNDAWKLVDDKTLPLPEPLADGDKRCAKCLHRRTCRGDAYLAKFAGADFDKAYVDVADPELIELANEYVIADEAADQAGAVVTAIKAKIKARMEADGMAKICIPDVIRFNLSTSAGRKSLDSKAVDGEINALNKGELPPIEDVTPEELLPVAPLLSKVLPAIARRFEACKKIGAPSTSFRPYAV